MSTRRRSTSRARAQIDEPEMVPSTPTKRSTKKQISQSPNKPAPPKSPRRSSTRSKPPQSEEEEEEEEAKHEQPAAKPTKRATKKQDDEIVSPKKTQSRVASSPKSTPAKPTTASKNISRVLDEEQDTVVSPTKARRSTRISAAATAAAAKADGLPPISPSGADHDGSSRLKSFLRRLWAGSLFFAVFCTGVHLGHPVLIPFVLLIQFMMYKELVDLSYSHLLELQHLEHVPLFRTQNWYWFAVASFYSYSRVLQLYTKIEVPYYLFISSSAFFLGFVWFVLTLRRDLYRVQFGMLAWTWLSLLIFVIVETAATVSVMFEGLIWLVLPAILIMTNDSWAYVWGLLFGKNSLIELSAKKTWEGFIGALISTPIQGFFMARWMAPHAILTCPQLDFPTFAHPICAVSPLFQFVPYQLGYTIPILGWDSILIAPIQIHAVWLSLFAGFIAPFGGFFASGFKRAFGIKDFGTFIPGHGGFTDRMDCQLVMGIFVYVYYYTFVKSSSFSTDCAALAADAATRNITADSLAALYQKLDIAGKASFQTLIK